MKKSLFSFFGIVSLLLTFWACNQVNVPPINDPEDLQEFLSDSLGIDSCIVGDTLMLSDLPINSQNYLSQNFPQDTLINVVLYTTNQDSLYQADLSSGTIVLFDGMGNYLQDGNPAIINPGDLEDAIKDTLEAYFPGLEIEEVELEWSYNGMFAYEIELESDVELYVFVSGNQICYVIEADHDDHYNYGGCDDDDHDEEDEYIPLDSLPVVIIQHIGTNYPTYTAEECAEIDTLCDSTAVFTIELEDNHDNELKLVYEQGGTFLYEMNKIPHSSLPQNVLNSISTSYAGFEWEEKAYKLTWANGTLQYQVELENEATDEELIVIFADDGTILCEKEEADD